MVSPRNASTSIKILRTASSHFRRPAPTSLAVRSTHATSSRSATSHPRHLLSSAAVRPSTVVPSPRLSPPMARSMFIQTETTPNADSLKFIPGTPVMETGSAEFLDARSALASPLALRLFGIEGIKAVFYGPDFVTVTKDAENPWSVLKPEVYSVLMEHFSAATATAGADSPGGARPLFRSEEDRVNAGPQDTRILETDSETDGGDIEYREFTDEGIVRLKLKGSCRGCDSSTVTLKTGIERMLVHYIPEVKGTEQVLDEEEKIAQDEFSRFEKRLHGKQQGKRDSDLAQYMST
ncbi:scaffold protein Nfu/NifU N terminal-domain-containing protein [Russula brevipes]|nr:scaffold protein Nfu/NifU N terminal-domain-containing protein [Russula brevipes]